MGVLVSGAALAGERAPARPLIGATVKISGAAPARPAIEQALEPARVMLRAAQVRQKELGALPGWPRVAELALEVAAIESNLAAGDVARAYDGARSWELRFMQQRVADDLLTAAPFRVLGPFHDARFARLAAWDAANRAAYLQIPYLDEFRAETNGTVNWKWLAQDFCPDLTRHYQIYGGVGGWQPALKTNALVLDGWNSGGDWTILYLYTEIFSPAAREGAILYHESENLAGYGAWLNGHWFGGVVGNFYEYGGRGNLKLAAGWNSLLLKIIQRAGARLTFTIVWGWTHAETTPMYDLQFRSGKAPE